MSGTDSSAFAASSQTKLRSRNGRWRSSFHARSAYCDASFSFRINSGKSIDFLLQSCCDSLEDAIPPHVAILAEQAMRVLVPQHRRAVVAKAVVVGMERVRYPYLLADGAGYVSQCRLAGDDQIEVLEDRDRIND